MKKYAHFAVAALLAGAVPAAALAEHRQALDHERALDALRAGAVAPLSAALAKVETQFPGHVLEVELEFEAGVFIYDIRILDPEGNVVKLKLDARDLAIRSVKGRGVRGEGR